MLFLFSAVTCLRCKHGVISSPSVSSEGTSLTALVRTPGSTCGDLLLYCMLDRFLSKFKLLMLRGFICLVQGVYSTSLKSAWYIKSIHCVITEETNE